MIAHKVESGRDVILDGVVYHPGKDKIVHLPRVFATDEVVPVEAHNADQEKPVEAKTRTRKVLDEAPAAGMTGYDIEEALNG